MLSGVRIWPPIFLTWFFLESTILNIKTTQTTLKPVTVDKRKRKCRVFIITKSSSDVQSWPNKFVLGCVIPPADAVARSRNPGQTFLANSVHVRNSDRISRETKLRKIKSKKFFSVLASSWVDESRINYANFLTPSWRIARGWYARGHETTRGKVKSLKSLAWTWTFK